MEKVMETKNHVIREKVYEGEKLVYEQVIGCDRNIVIEAEHVETTINVPLQITASWVSYRGDVRTDDNAPIELTIEADGAEIAQVELIPIDGVAEFDFVSEVTGVHTLTARGLNGTFRKGVLKVVVNNA